MAANKSNLFYRFVRKYNVSKRLFICYFIALSVILYFLFFTIFGDKGFIKLLELQRIIYNKESIKSEYQEKLKLQKNMVDGMKSKSLDLDLLDEQTRKNLGYVGKNEIVIHEEENEK